MPPIVDVIPKKESIPDSNAPINAGEDSDILRILPVPTEDTSVIMNPKPEDRPTSFFSQPGILAGMLNHDLKYFLYTGCFIEMILKEKNH